MRRFLLTACLAVTLCGAEAADPGRDLDLAGVKLEQAERLNTFLGGELKKPESERTLTLEMMRLGISEVRRLLNEATLLTQAPDHAPAK